MAAEDPAIVLWKFSSENQTFKFIRTTDFEDSPEDTLLDKIPDPTQQLCGAFFGFGLGNDFPLTPVETKPIFEKSKNSQCNKFVDEKPPKNLLAFKIGAFFGKHKETLQSNFSKTLGQNKIGFLIRLLEQQT